MLFMKMIQRLFACMMLLMLGISNVAAEEIRVAVASNFSGAIKEIVRQFELKSSHKVYLSIGSTGKHYAQIKHGAPFEVFFAADVKRPELLDQEGLAMSGSRFTYAVGKIVLWSPRPNFIDLSGNVLEQGEFRYLSLANPKLAPYGKAAQQVLNKRGMWNELKGRMVRGENIGQTFQFVKSGNAALGFVAYSQIISPDSPITGSFWAVPQSLYDAIEQQAVLLKDNNAAREFVDFVKSNESRKVIRSFGYGTP